MTQISATILIKIPGLLIRECVHIPCHAFPSSPYDLLQEELCYPLIALQDFGGEAFQTNLVQLRKARERAVGATMVDDGGRKLAADAIELEEAFGRRRIQHEQQAFFLCSKILLGPSIPSGCDLFQWRSWRVEPALPTAARLAAPRLGSVQGIDRATRRTSIKDPHELIL